MGLIRKTLAVGTVGVVKPNSKKQRMAKATAKNTAEAAAAAAQAVAVARQAEDRAAQQAQEEREFRYATDPAYKKFVDDKRAAEAEAARLERERLEAIARVKRLRREERNAAISHGAVRTALVAAALIVIPIVALAVWLPQIVIAKSRHEPWQPWRSDALTRPFKRREP